MIAQSLNQYLLKFVLGVLFIRLFTELPRALTALGIASMPDLDYNRAMSGLLILVLLVSILLRQKIHVARPAQQLIVLLLLLFVLAIVNAVVTLTFYGMSYTGIMVAVMRFGSQLLLALFAWNFIQSDKDISICFTYFYRPALWIIIAISLTQIVTSKYAIAQGLDRLIGPFGNPNTLAMFMHLFIMLTFVFYKDGSRVTLWILLGLQYIIILYTGSITAVLSSLFFVSMLTVWQRWYKLKRFYFVVPFVVMAFMIGILIKLESIVNRLSIIFNLDTFKLTPGSSIRWRFTAWEHYLSLLDNPFKLVVGLGIGVQRFIFLLDYPGNLDKVFEAPGTHNDYLAILVDFGIIGLMFLFTAVFFLNKYLKKLETYNAHIRYFRYFFYTILFAMLIENVIDQLVMSVFIFFLVAFCKLAYVRKENGWA